MEKLNEIKNLINDEIALYTELSSLFEKKRKVLIANDVENLLAVDEEILIKVEEIKASVNYRQTITAHIGRSDMSLSEMIDVANKFDKNLSEELSKAQKQINSLIEKLAGQERVIKELLRHGMTMVSKTLNMISNAVSVAGDYNSSGKNVQSEIDKISSIVEEV